MGAESAYGLWILVAINSASIGLALRNSEPVANAAGHSYGIEGGEDVGPNSSRAPVTAANSAHVPLSAESDAGTGASESAMAATTGTQSGIRSRAGRAFAHP